MPRQKSKQEQSFAKLLENDVPALQNQAKNGDVSGALEGLFLLEKQTRQGGDFTTCSKIAREIVRICFQAANWNQLNDTLVMLSKRRGQSKTVIQESVQEAMGFLDTMDELPVAVELIKTLRSITEGKIFAEIEAAELTKRLADIYEKTGKIHDAAKVLQEVQVETLSKMETKEKVNYILEQVRLCLLSNDFIRAYILSKKINQKLLVKDEFQNEKLRYHNLMITYYHKHEQHADIARAYQAIYNTPQVQDDEMEWRNNLKLLCIYSVLSPYSLEQSDLINRTNNEKKLEELPLYKSLLKRFLTTELMSWPSIRETYQEELNSFSEFSGDSGKALWEVLQLRIVEHVSNSISISIYIFVLICYM